METTENAAIIRIDLPAQSRAYDIVIGASSLALAGDFIYERLGQRRCVVITDTNVQPLYHDALAASLEKSEHELLSTITIPAGEQSKSWPTLQNTIEQILAANADRRTLIIALGGGVVGDLAGCAAALSLRGLDLIQVPTTLLSQIDSSVGGKNGINSQHGKNTVGAFYQPKLVLIDPFTLNTLPKREVLAGYAELLKYGLIRSAEFFKWCEDNGNKLIDGDMEARSHAIGECCKYKAQVVIEDELESGERALLNLGHTFGHALESVLGYESGKILHGEAVAIGMLMAFNLSARMNLCPQADVEVLKEHMLAVGLPIFPPKFEYNIDVLMNLMTKDKKAEAGTLTLILAHGIGKAFISRIVDPELVRHTWRETLHPSSVRTVT
ncbi:MAG: 3-dehydroquinate synthase [Alphaproteobacteria bacterium]|nr:3-dehydroquinate synthase [Alphaproteobacteria bacterium]